MYCRVCFPGGVSLALSSNFKEQGKHFGTSEQRERRFNSEDDSQLISLQRAGRACGWTEIYRQPGREFVQLGAAFIER